MPFFDISWYSVSLESWKLKPSNSTENYTCYHRFFASCSFPRHLYHIMPHIQFVLMTFWRALFILYCNSLRYLICMPVCPIRNYIINFSFMWICRQGHHQHYFSDCLQKRNFNSSNETVGSILSIISHIKNDTNNY